MRLSSIHIDYFNLSLEINIVKFFPLYLLKRRWQSLLGKHRGQVYTFDRFTSLGIVISILRACMIEIFNHKGKGLQNIYTWLRVLLAPCTLWDGDLIFVIQYCYTHANISLFQKADSGYIPVLERKLASDMLICRNNLCPQSF